MRLSRVLLAAGLVFVGLIGASEAGQFLVVVRAIAAGVGGVLIAVYLVRAPQRHDRIDLAVLIALITFLLACITSSIPRLSFDAATTAIAYAAAFYVARDAVADADGRELAVTVLGLMGALVSIGYFAAWASAWLRWAAVPGAGIPPVGLALPPAPYGHHYLVATLVAMLLPACVALARRPLVWPLGIAGTVAGFAVVVMSGSRTVWMSVLVALVVAAALGARVAWLRWRWIVPAAVVALGALVVIGGELLERLATTSTVASRLGIYAASVYRWLDSVLLGHGPGTYSAQMTVVGPLVPEELLTHGHNALVQMLVEGGIAGVAGLLVLAWAVVSGIIRERPRDTTAIAGLTVFAVGAMTDNPTVFGFLVVPAIAWAALACPREPAPVLTRTRWTMRLNLGLAAVGAVAVAATLGAAWFYERAAPAANAGDSSAVLASLDTATTFDPGHPLYQRDLGIWLLASGRTQSARDRLALATAGNHADPVARRASAVAEATAGDSHALDILTELVERQPDDAMSHLTAAYVARILNLSTPTAYGALERSLRYEPWMTATEAWHEEFGEDVHPRLEGAQASWTSDSTGAQEHHRARAWLAAMVGAPKESLDLSDADAAAAAVIDCRPEDALELLGPMSESGSDAEWLLARILAARAQGEPVDDYVTLAGLRSPIIAFLASNEVPGTSPFTAIGFDVQFYGRRAIPLPEGLPVFPSAASGLSAWLRDPAAAADQGAPNSGLAACR